MSKRRIIYSLMAVLMLLMVTGCKDTLGNWLDGDAPDMKGEAITFTSQLPAVQSTPTTKSSVNTELLNGYKVVNQNYTFQMYMQKEGSETKSPDAHYTSSSDSQDGQLTIQTGSILCWQDNVNKYGFKAIAGSADLQTDQSTQANWIMQDRLLGFGYEPLLGDDGKTPVDKLEDYNYRTNKEWYLANKEWMSETELVTDEEYKRVPLFLQHKRSLVTVIVKAGDGVKRSEVLAENAATKLDTHIYSYTQAADATTPTSQEITPLAGKETIHYDKDVNGEAEDNEVARYDAVVEPYNYIPSSSSDEDTELKICSINLSNQHFSFYASNDTRYADYKSLESDDAKESSEFGKAYNLKAGENLVITVTLSRDSRKILMTAYVQPWTDVVTSYVCDDFGNAGNPTIIDSQEDLVDFLANEKLNASGNVAILNTDGLTLSDEWTNIYDLNAIFNLGNHTLTLSNRLFRNITASGSVINGTLKVKKGTNVPTVVCQTNRGTVDRLTLMNDDDDNRAVVTKAAVAETNYGYISNVTSYIKVDGTSNGSDQTYIGGIAAVSKSESGTLLPSITGCMVDARVGVATGQSNVNGGGIVGLANGYVTGNTFEYGVTISQAQTSNNVKNIVYAKEEGTLITTDNQWPTTATSTPKEGETITNTRDEADRYDQVVDSQDELKMLVKEGSVYNTNGRRYRLSDDFTVLSQDWTLGVKNDQQTNEYWGNVLFTLDGNNKTITLDGTETIEYKETKDGETQATYITAPMLFCNIMGTVKDLNINCKESLYGVPTYGDSGDNTSQDICAPLAYSVIGGTVENVSVHAVKKSDNSYPQIVAAIPGGMVVWACNGATIKNCTSDMGVVMKVASNFSGGGDQRHYAGGLVAEVAKATITQCQYAPRTDYEFKCYKGSETSASGVSDHVNFGGIVGGTLIKNYTSAGSTETPAVTISDCSSWYSFDAENVKYTEGSIIGRSIYVSGTTNVSGVNKDCQGNWWPEGTKAVGEGGTDEKVIGKKNSVTPDKPTLED